MKVIKDNGIEIGCWQHQSSWYDFWWSVHDGSCNQQAIGSRMDTCSANTSNQSSFNIVTKIVEINPKHKELQKLRHQYKPKIVAAATHYSWRCTQEISTKLLEQPTDSKRRRKFLQTFETRTDSWLPLTYVFRDFSPEGNTWVGG